jgi:hypothetical protein
MSITNYAELQASVASWLNRGDLTASVPDFVTLAECQLNIDLKARAMDSKTTLTTVVGTNTVPLPTDMLGMRRIQVLGSYNQPLSYRSPDEISADFSANTSGMPAVFTVIGSNVELAPIPDAVYSLELTYQQKIPALSASSTTNWLLTSWPNAYLYGSLLAATPFIMNDARLPVWQALYKIAVDGINDTDWYSGSTMKVRAR